MTTSSQIYSAANEAATLAACRRPDGTREIASEAIPSAGEDGVDLGVLQVGNGIGARSMSALFTVVLREVAHARTAYVKFTGSGSNVSAGTYSITLNSTTYSTTLGSTTATATLYATLAALITAGSIATATVSTLPSDDTVSAIKIVGDSEDDFSVSAVVSVSGHAVEADCVYATGTVWLQEAAQDSEVYSWVAANGFTDFGVGLKGVTERLAISGYRRAYVQVEDKIGDPSDMSTYITYIARAGIRRGIHEQD